MSRIDDLSGRAVHITGASSGIGAAFARAFGAFLFQASNELSGYITGNIVHVNGGTYMP